MKKSDKKSIEKKNKKNKTKHFLDKIAAIIIPSLFVLFNIIYWVYNLSEKDESFHD